jgi:hypothetical protein
MKCIGCGDNEYSAGYSCTLCGNGSKTGTWDKVFNEHKTSFLRPKGEGTTMTVDDNSNIVNEPKHYARWVIEPITYIMLNGFEFWRGNIVKYASRAGFKLYEGKTQEESEIIDLQKVIRYSEMRINQINNKEKL